MESLLQLNDYESIADEWAIIEQVETTCYHTLDIAHLTYLYYLPQVLHYYQVQVCINIVSNICGIVGIRQRGCEIRCYHQKSNFQHCLNINRKTISFQEPNVIKSV